MNLKILSIDEYAKLKLILSPPPKDLSLALLMNNLTMQVFLRPSIVFSEDSSLSKNAIDVPYIIESITKNKLQLYLN